MKDDLDFAYFDLDWLLGLRSTSKGLELVEGKSKGEETLPRRTQSYFISCPNNEQEISAFVAQNVLIRCFDGGI